MRLARATARRTAPVLVAVVLAASSALAYAPFAPGTRALDPTPDPGASAVPTAEPAPDPTTAPLPTPVPTSTPTSTPTVEPSPEPTAVPTAEPTAVPTSTPVPSAVPTTAPEATATPTPAPTATPVPTPAPGTLVVGHAWVDTVATDGSRRPGVADAPRTQLERFTIYWVRFQVANTGGLPIEVAPVLQAAFGASPGAFMDVPALDPALDRPFYVAAPRGSGRTPVMTAIPAGALRLGPGPSGTSGPVAGVSSMGINPMPVLTLGPGEYTEVEFAVRATTWAPWQGTYQLRLVDDNGTTTAAPGAARAAVTLRSKPPVRLSPGQKSGVGVDEPLPLYPLARPTAPTGSTAGLYGSIGPAGSSRSGWNADAQEPTPHQPYGLASDSCAACHSTHTGQAALLRAEPAPLASLCFRCHDGSGSSVDVQAELQDPTLPVNDPSTASWYSHPAFLDAAHATDRENEFEGVLDRHAACADCHQPHRADGTLAAQTTGGWTASGAIVGASGVAVVNGPAGSEPAYTWTRTSAFEYELCFKCHSGFTELPARDPAHPSRWAIDKAVELNPANLSYHPVQAAGTNATSEMSASLAGMSPYKLWNFEVDSTIRCLNCHGNGDLLVPGTAPEARLSNHASRNRGILLENYRDRSLLGSLETYDAADFALCYLCHAEAPMVDASGDPRADTNFGWHGFHLNAILGIGSLAGDIDTDGAGQGNAVCAECHFRIHGTTDAVDGQPATTRLVNFAPNVQPEGGLTEFDPAGPGLGSCTLTCHGEPHAGFLYD